MRLFLKAEKKTRTHLKSEDDTEESVEVDFVCVQFVFHFVPTSLKNKQFNLIFEKLHFHQEEDYSYFVEVIEFLLQRERAVNA